MDFKACGSSDSLINPNGSTAAIEGRRTVEVTMAGIEGVKRIYGFRDVLYVPSYGVNLMSVSAAEEKGNRFNPVIRCGEEESANGVVRQTLLLQPLVQQRCEGKCKQSGKGKKLWHRSLGHRNHRDVVVLMKGIKAQSDCGAVDLGVC